MKFGLSLCGEEVGESAESEGGGKNGFEVLFFFWMGGVEGLA